MKSANGTRMTPEQRMRMRRVEVVCERAIARLRGLPEPGVKDVLDRRRTLELPLKQGRAVTLFARIRSIGNALAAIFPLNYLAAAGWWRRR